MNDDDLSGYEHDPVASALRRTRNDVQALRSELYRAAENANLQTWVREHERTLDDIGSKDEDFRDIAKRQELIGFAQAQGIGDLRLAHQLKTRERDIQRAREQGVKEAKEQAAARRAAQPSTPNPSTDPFEDALQRALADPDLEGAGREFRRQNPW